MFDLKRTAFPSMIPVGFSPNLELKKKSRGQSLNIYYPYNFTIVNISIIDLSKKNAFPSYFKNKLT